MTTFSDMPASPNNSKARVIGYWIVTAFLVFELIYGALWDFNLLNKGYVYGVLDHLGYPMYLANILAFSKIAATIVILAPNFRLLKEWAYAGIIILFMGGFVSHLLVGDGWSQFIWSLLFGVLALISWKLNYRTPE